jgi:hypothetical protein
VGLPNGTAPFVTGGGLSSLGGVVRRMIRFAPKRERETLIFVETFFALHLCTRPYSNLDLTRVSVGCRSGSSNRRPSSASSSSIWISVRFADPPTWRTPHTQPCGLPCRRIRLEPLHPSARLKMDSPLRLRYTHPAGKQIPIKGAAMWEGWAGENCSDNRGPCGALVCVRARVGGGTTPMPRRIGLRDPEGVSAP